MNDLGDGRSTHRRRQTSDGDVLGSTFDVVELLSGAGVVGLVVGAVAAIIYGTASLIRRLVRPRKGVWRAASPDSGPGYRSACAAELPTGRIEVDRGDRLDNAARGGRSTDGVDHDHLG